MENPDDTAVAARIQLLLESERRANEERLARRRRQVMAGSLIVVLPALAWALVMLVRQLL